ncbi:hypothetical protein TUBRATIS_31090 [Tubulinosema ratisbonensis]|uniref:Uncharacterized protein n=1 Tax=Tubulinosema ratisbonensis TaxID=291195 RepID=A0A437AHD6_9MICR|nr:hypothetical protein TUBRATIS_31090 [Tubulinosema ratisbonensis]
MIFTYLTILQLSQSTINNLRTNKTLNFELSETETNLLEFVTTSSFLNKSIDTLRSINTERQFFDYFHSIITPRYYFERNEKISVFKLKRFFAIIKKGLGNHKCIKFKEQLDNIVYELTELNKNIFLDMRFVEQLLYLLNVQKDLITNIIYLINNFLGDNKMYQMLQIEIIYDEIYKIPHNPNVISMKLDSFFIFNNQIIKFLQYLQDKLVMNSG